MGKHDFWRRGLGSLVITAAATLGSLSAHAQTPAAAPLPGVPTLALASYDLAALGYSTSEYTLTGTAKSYRLIGEARADGHWTAIPDAQAAYKTRIVVLRPTDPKQFNGTVVVEWLNVSGGLDVPVDWMTLHREMVRGGYAYVAVSAQKVGVDGGASLGRGPAQPLKKANPQRYGDLNHPGDAFSFDIYSDVARLLKSKQGPAVLGDLKPRHVLAVGESQSAFFLSTYVNAVDPLARLYDGFLIHSRVGAVEPIDGRSMLAASGDEVQHAIPLRTDLRVPVMQVLTETDVVGFMGVVGFHAARQPDSARLRTWEIAGAAHADNYLFRVGAIDSGLLPIDQLAKAWEPLDNIQGFKIPQAMNNAPQHHYVTQAALAHLTQWVSGGKAPPQGPRLELAPGLVAALSLDAQGNARGGIRSPWVDAPVTTLSGVGAAPPVPLVGSTRPFDEATLNRLYPAGKSGYLNQFTAALDRAIAAGFILPADRQEIIGLADHGYRGGQ